MKAEYSISKEIIPGDWRRMNLSLDAREGETEKEFMDRVAGTVDSWFEQRFGIHPPPILPNHHCLR